MAIESLNGWVAKANDAAARAMAGFEERNGYEPDLNEIVLADRRLSAEERSLLTPDLQAFFDVVDEVSWPDVWNGYFLGPVDWVLERRATSDPGRLEVGETLSEIIAVGSDGSGAFFVLDVVAGVVLHVVEPTVVDGILRGDAREVARDFDAFLEALVTNAGLVARGDGPRF